MAQELCDLLQVLRFELNYLEQGGFGQDGSLSGTESPFKGTFACINFGDPQATHACRECLLHQFVPQSKQSEDIPCHYIVLNDAGETIAELLEKKDSQRMVIALEEWLRSTIARLETQKEEVGTKQ